MALLGAIFYFVVPDLPDFSTVWAHVTAMSGIELGILAAVAAWNLATQQRETWYGRTPVPVESVNGD